MGSKKNIVEDALSLLRTLPRLSLGNVRPIIGFQKKPPKHRGDQRKANKGMSRNCPRQAYFALGSESKKNPFFMAMPLEDYYDKIKGKREYPPVSLLTLQRMIDTNRIDASKPIDLVALNNTGLCHCKPSINHFGFNLTEEGADLFKAKVNIEVQWASEAAIAAIERNGGVITTAYYDIRSLKAMTNPKKFFEQGVAIPKRLNPPEDAILFYTGAATRGYLADPEQISWERLVLAQKYGYKLPKIEEDPNYAMLMQRKDPRQIFFGLHPGWVVNLREKYILKSLDPSINEYYRT